MGMTAHDPSLHRQSNGILRLLGIGRRSDENGLDAAGPESADAAAGPPLTPGELARRQLVADIGTFLHAHQLEASAYTLAVAHDYLIGAEPEVARQIDRQIHARQPVTLEWLEQISHSSGRADDAEMLAALMTKLETSLEEFGKTTKAAKSATSEYNSALEHHMGELEQVSKAGVVITELALIARVMLERTREIEKDMTRSELQTRSLKRSLEQARRSADHDHLTGLPNRRAFEGLLDSEYKAAIAAKEPMCVAFIDIDHFKQVNDTHGHDAGDRVLKVVAQNLSRISGDKCHVARHGGEEFVVVLRGKTLADSWEILDEARSEMAERRLVNRSNDQPFGKITFSGGVADVFAHTDPRAALKAADEALYIAKDQGRNRIVVAAKPAATASAG
jgi:diguanylate cyclase